MRLGQAINKALGSKISFQGLTQSFNLALTGKWLLLSILVGVVAGLGAAAFQYALDFVLAVSWSSVLGLDPTGPAGETHLVHFPRGHDFIPWLLLVVPTVGGLVSGFIVFRFAPEAEGHGTDGAIEAYHEKDGFIRRRVPFVKLIASAITIGTGGSAGREGPIAQIGAGFGSFLATTLRLSKRERRLLLAAGLGAGVAAIFRAPLAGALFAAEVMYSEAEFEHDVLVPATMASITSYSVFGLLFGFGHLFADTAHLTFRHPLELGPYLLLAFLTAGAAMTFSWAFYRITDWFASLRLPKVFRPALGGLMTGAVGMSLYYVIGGTDVLAVMGAGYGFLQKAISSPYALGSSGLLILAVVAGGKILTTGLSIGSGGSGGVFGPSMVIGGALGGVVGVLFHQIWPEVVQQPGAYVVVGMAGFFAAAANTPVSTVIMVSELTGNYQLLVPTMWVSAIAFVLARRSGLYKNQVPNRLYSQAHAEDFIIDVLERMRVKDVFHSDHRALLLPRDMLLGDILELVASSHQSQFPVIDEQGKLCGVFAMDDLRPLLFDESVHRVIIAGDIAKPSPPTLTPQDSLSRALRTLSARNVDEVPVVDPHDPRHYLGMLKRWEVVAAYNRRVQQMKET